MRKPRAIGLAVDTAGSYGREVIQGVMTFCHRHPHWRITAEPRLFAYYEEVRPSTLNVEGLIIQGATQETVDELSAKGIHVVNVLNTTAASRHFPTIAPDDEGLGFMAADHLVSLNFRNFGYVLSGADDFSRQRGNAFHQRLKAAGRIASECDASRESLSDYLASLKKPAAVFCCNDVWAHRALMAAWRRNLKVPDEIAVLGVDNDELLDTIGALPLSSIAIPAEKIGFEAAQLLEAAFNGKTLPKRIKLPPLNVVSRATTKIVSDKPAEVLDALQFIEMNLSQKIQVDDVLAHLPMARRSLERKFRTSLGRSIGSEIRRARLARAKQLLAHTEMPIEEVAAASGFANATMLGIHFRRDFGESPSGFRKRTSIRPVERVDSPDQEVLKEAAPLLKPLPPTFVSLDRIWPDDPPAPLRYDQAEEGETLSVDPTHPTDFTVKDTTRPWLACFAPQDESGAELPPRTAVIICAGGGYYFQAIGHEGIAVARQLAADGVVAFVLKYRLPNGILPADGSLPHPPVDLLRAIQFIREHHSRWNIHPDRLGVLGFSAGGHLASSSLTLFHEMRSLSPEDGPSLQSPRPDFGILVYPVISMDPKVGKSHSARYLLGESPDPAQMRRFSANLNVTAYTPPMFIVHAEDDQAITYRHSEVLAAAAKAAGIPHEYLQLKRDGHAFGLGTGPDSKTWYPRCLAWLRDLGLLETMEKQAALSAS